MCHPLANASQRADEDRLIRFRRHEDKRPQSPSPRNPENPQPPIVTRALAILAVTLNSWQGTASA